MIPHAHALDKLKSLLEEDKHLFAPSLCNFLCELENNKELSAAINTKVITEETEDKSSLHIQESQLLTIIKSEYEKIEQYYKKHSIELPIGFMGKKGISEFHAYERGKIVSSDEIINSLIRAHSNALNNLIKRDLDFVRQFAFTNENGDIIALRISKLLIEWEAKKHSFNRTQKGKFWYAYKQLNRFHNTYQNFEHLKIDALIKGQLFEEWQLCEDFKRIDGLIKGKDIQYIHELKFYTKQILHVIQQTSQQKTPQNTLFLKNKNVPHNYKEVFATLTERELILSTDGKEDITFDKYKIKNKKEDEIFLLRLLLLLCQNPQGISKKELREKLNATDKEINRARRGINDRIKKEWSLKDKYIVQYQRRKGLMKFDNQYPTQFINNA